MDNREKAYQEKFNETMDTETRAKALEVKVAELRRQTDLTYQLHPLFGRAEATMARLNERDFEEIRTYRAPPISIVLVVEAVCVLFHEQPIWETGQILLHRENFFQDLEFFDKENITQSNYRKMKQRLDQIDEMEVRRASMAALSLFFWLQAIAAYYQSYARLKPLLRQRGIDEGELARLQRKLGADRVQLHESKHDYDEADEFTLELAQQLLNQRSKIRRLSQERDDAATFYDDLMFCSKEWQNTKGELKSSIENFESEMLIASMFVFLVLRYQPHEAQELIDAMTMKDDQLVKLSDRRTLLARFNGRKYETHERGVEHLLEILKEENVDHFVLNWHQTGSHHNDDRVLISARHDRQDLIVEFKRRFSHASKEATNQHMLLRDRAIIENEIEEFDLRLYNDLCSDQYDYGYLRRLISKRRQTRAEWSRMLSDTKSMMKPSVHFDVIDYSLAARDIFVEHIDGGVETPLHLALINEAIVATSAATIDATLAQLTTVFVRTMIQYITAYCAAYQAVKFKQHFILFLLNRRNDSFQCETLVDVLISGESVELDEQLLDDVHLIEHVTDTQFSPLTPCWKYQDMSPTQMIIYHRQMTTSSTSWECLERIALGGYQIKLDALNIKQQIIPLLRHNGTEKTLLSQVIEARLSAQLGTKFYFNSTGDNNETDCQIWTKPLQDMPSASVVVLESEETHQS